MTSMAAMIIMLLKVIVVFVVLLLCVAYLTWLERKVLGHMQVRYGPMRTGWHGLLQPIADGIKLFFKEDIVVEKANKVIYVLAPFIVAVCAFASFAVVPFGNVITLFGHTIDLRVADVDIGILYIFALGSMNVYGVTLAGWASNNKYALMGGIRSSAQMISYEIAMGLSVIGVLMLTGSLSLVEVVKAQSDIWYVVQQPIGFIIAHMIVMGSLITTLFLGGWHLPFVDISSFQPSSPAGQLAVALIPMGVFGTKVFLCLFFFIWLRATYPRLRYDQLMEFGWKVLFPLALLNIVVTAVLIMVNLL